jgi:transposase
MSSSLWAGLDVGVETTAICVIDDTGAILQQSSCRSDLQSVHCELRWLRRRRRARVGLEASGTVALARGLRSLGYSVDLYETRQLSKFLRVRRNKTDAGDAIGIAEAGRLGASLVSKVHLQSLECQSLQSRLTIRRYMIRQRVAPVNLLCRQIEHYGGRIARCPRSLRLAEAVEREIGRLFGKTSSPLIAELRRLARDCERLVAYQLELDCELRRMALGNEICRRFMEIPGVGPICALSFYAAVGDPHRFSRSTDIGCYFGLTPRLHQSGLTRRVGRISRMGNAAVRSLLVRASLTLIKSGGGAGALQQWASGVEQRRGRGQARVALARKLGVIMLTMWKKGEPYQPGPSAAEP